jgi:hypothetical protein
MRSGSSSLFRYLADHPDVFMAEPKELHYFDRWYERGPDWYAAHFSAAPPGTTVGEATPNYLYDPIALSRLRSDVPEVRTLATLRHPVDRAYSHYNMEFARGREPRSWADVVEAELEQTVADGYLDRSMYGRQLSTLVDLFGPDRIFVLAFEELRDRPEATFTEVCQYLGVAPEIPSSVGRQVNAYFRIRSQRLRKLSKRPSTTPVVRKVLARVNQREETYPPMAADLHRRLSLHFADDAAAAFAVAGWDRDPWHLSD